MKYISTRKSEQSDIGGISSSLAILRGIAPDGGLYIPSSLPKLGREELLSLAPLGYIERCAKILSYFLTDYTEEELLTYAKAAYGEPKFPAIKTPLADIGEGRYSLELFRGPTCAFKDMALQILPHLLRAASDKNGSRERICILVATSGDTGKAALEGFADVEGTSIFVFYPRDGVSEIQKLQMTTQSGANVAVCAVEGNFDDAQTGVKRIFADRAYGEALAAKGIRLSSANSINWGRLVPQVVYYISAYLDLVTSGKIKFGEEVNVAVPTGNFGNILAAYIAKLCSLPIGRLICASNSNNVLSDFINGGIYDRNRRFFTTCSPSMDILISSNVERLLSFLTSNDPARVSELMASLSSSGRYSLSENEKALLSGSFNAGWASEEETFAALRRTFLENGYLADTHTSVALAVLSKYRADTGDMRKTIVASTASPFKFAESVLFALDGKKRASSPALLSELSEKASVEIPLPLASLSGRERRFTGCVAKEKMPDAVMKALFNK